MINQTSSFKTRKELKEEVKALFKKRWFKRVPLLGFVTFLPAIIVSIFNGSFSFAVFIDAFASALQSQTEYVPSSGLIFSFSLLSIIGLLLQLFLMPINKGVQFKQLESLRNPQTQTSFWHLIFFVYKKKRTWKFIGLMLVQFIFIALWTLLFIIPGIIKSFSYSQSLYIWFDSVKAGKELSILQCITKSRQLMDGQKWNLCVLYLSFLGWILLFIVITMLVQLILFGLLNLVHEHTFMIPVLLILGFVAFVAFFIALFDFIMYVNTTLAAFYKDRINMNQVPQSTRENNASLNSFIE